MDKNVSANSKHRTVVLTMYCPDQRGIISAITRFLYENNGNILYLAQHVDNNETVFFMRIEWDLKGFRIPSEEISNNFHSLANKFNMTWKIFFSWDVPNMAVFVSKLSHCLDDILARYNSGELNINIPLIISNHNDLQKTAEKFNIHFYCLTKNIKDKTDKENKEISLLTDSNVDFIVLARYMQVLSGDFIRKFENRIINIHHSFLPAFPGAKPYQAAFERGVKIIGATSHYVTEELDSGPIIEQDITHITHRDSVQDMIRKGRDLEKIVL